MGSISPDNDELLYTLQVIAIVLYLALEDDYAGLQRRLSEMFGVESADNLSNRFHEIYTENQERKEIVRDYECVKAVLGKESVSGIVQMEKQRGQLLKEQKRTERRRQNREAR